MVLIQFYIGSDYPKRIGILAYEGHPTQGNGVRAIGGYCDNLPADFCIVNWTEVCNGDFIEMETRLDGDWNVFDIFDQWNSLVY